MSIPKNSCLILGGTGAVGKSLVKDVLANNAFTRVLTLGRRPLPTEGDSSFKNLSLLEQQTVDLENPGSTFPSDLPQIVFCTLGTTRAAAGSAEAFKRIDQGYVLDAARHIHEKAPKDPVTGLAKVHFLYCSSAGSSHKSYLLYSKTKGETENALAEIGFERVSIFQPGFLKVVEPRNSGSRIAETVLDKVMPVLDYFAERSVSAGVDKVAETMRLVAMSDSVEVEGVKPKRVETHNKSTVAFYSNADIHDIVNHHESSKL